MVRAAGHELGWSRVVVSNPQAHIMQQVQSKRDAQLTNQAAS